MPVPSLSVDAQALAITPSGGTPELGVTVSWALGGRSGVGVGVAVAVGSGVAVEAG